MNMDFKLNLSTLPAPTQQRSAAVARCMEALAHSYACTDAFCRQSACARMKRVVIHSNICERKNKGSCPICKQLIAMCCYHARECKNMMCTLPYCNIVKQKARRRRLLFERLRVARGLLADELGDIDANVFGRMTSWRLVRVMARPRHSEGANDVECQEASTQTIEQADESESNSLSAAEADNNNVGENNNDSSDASTKDGGSNEDDFNMEGGEEEECSDDEGGSVGSAE